MPPLTGVTRPPYFWQNLHIYRWNWYTTENQTHQSYALKGLMAASYQSGGDRSLDHRVWNITFTQPWEKRTLQRAKYVQCNKSEHRRCHDDKSQDYVKEVLRYLRIDNFLPLQMNVRDIVLFTPLNCKDEDIIVLLFSSFVFFFLIDGTEGHICLFATKQF